MSDKAIDKTRAEFEESAKHEFAFIMIEFVDGRYFAKEPYFLGSDGIAAKANEAFYWWQAAKERYGQKPVIARSLPEWHEDDGPVLWWAWCGNDWAGEPAWSGSPLDDDWPGYHTHWTPHPKQPATKEQKHEQ